MATAAILLMIRLSPQPQGKSLKWHSFEQSTASRWQGFKEN